MKNMTGSLFLYFIPNKSLYLPSVYNKSTYNGNERICNFRRISEAQVETAVLVGLITKTQDERKTNEYLDELAFLAETAGAEVVKRFTQKLDQANSVTYVGKGKLDEIKQYIKDEEEAEREIGMVIFDDELSAKQIRKRRSFSTSSPCVHRRLMLRRR